MWPGSCQGSRVDLDARETCLPEEKVRKAIWACALPPTAKHSEWSPTLKLRFEEVPSRRVGGKVPKKPRHGFGYSSRLGELGKGTLISKNPRMFHFYRARPRNAKLPKVTIAALNMKPRISRKRRLVLQGLGPLRGVRVLCCVWNSRHR